MIRSWRAPHEHVLLAADHLLEQALVRRHDELDLRVLASFHRAAIVAEPMERGHGFLSRSPDGAVISVKEDLAATTTGRFAVAHELGHLVLHPDIGALAFCEPSGRFHQRETDASDFGARLLLPPRFLGACDGSYVDATQSTAARFGVPLGAAAQALLDHHPTPAAAVHERDGLVLWWAKADGFPIKPTKKHRVPPRREGAELVTADHFSTEKKAKTVTLRATSFPLTWPEEGTLHLLEPAR